jgi:hypothetical protein
MSDIYLSTYWFTFTLQNTTTEIFNYAYLSGVFQYCTYIRDLESPVLAITSNVMGLRSTTRTTNRQCEVMDREKRATG